MNILAIVNFLAIIVIAIVLSYRKGLVDAEDAVKMQALELYDQGFEAGYQWYEDKANGATE